MIAKLICWLFGHKFYMDLYTGETATLTDNLTGGDRKVPLMKRVLVSRCDRCGKQLTN